MLLESNPLAIPAFKLSHPEFAIVENEDLVDLQMSIMNQPEAYSHVIKCNALLKYKNRELSNLLIYKIPIMAFKVMFDEATSKRLNTDKYITAVKIYMASNGTGMAPIFQPIYLKHEDYDPATQKDLYRIPTAYGNGSYYTFDGTGFNKITNDNDRINLVKDYTNGNMTLMHRSGDTFRAFIQDTDVESCLFPFQTIYKVMQDSSSNYMFLTNAIREVHFDSACPNKHVFIVSGEEIKTGSPLVQAKYANRSHLCPPCNSVDFGFDLAI